MKTVVLPQPVGAKPRSRSPPSDSSRARRRGPASSTAQAGRLFRVRGNGQQGVRLYRGGPEGLRQISQGTNNAIQASSLNRLAAELKGSEAVLSVNGERVYGHAAEAGTSLRGQVGIVAIDKGAYKLRRLRGARRQVKHSAGPCR